MFYVRLKLQKRKGPTILKGPSFHFTRQKSIDIDGSQVRFLAPRKRTESHIMGLREPRKHYNVLNPETPYPIVGTDLEGWHSIPVLGRRWDFFGPWFTGRLAYVYCAFRIIQGEKPAEASYFHPRVFESAVLDRMAVSYKEVFQGRQDRFAPTHWQPLKHFPCPAARYVAEPNRRNCPIDDNHYYLMFSLHNDYLFEIRLELLRSPKWVNGKRDNDLEKWTPIAPMETFINQVLDSIEVTLSPEAKAQMQKAQEGLEDTSLVKEFPPVNILEYQRNKEKQTEAPAKLA